METKAATLIRRARHRAGTSQGRHAQLAGTSRTRLNSYENGGVDPTVGTLERLLTPAGLTLEAVPVMRFEDRRSLAFGEAIAIELERRADEVLAQARANLKHMLRIDAEHGKHSTPLLRVWAALLDVGPNACKAALRSRDELGQTLRTASPFGGILTDEQRREIISRTRAET